MMFLKAIITVDPDQNPKDLEALLDALNNKVEIANDGIVLEGMVADSLDASSPTKMCMMLIIDATTILVETQGRTMNHWKDHSSKIRLSGAKDLLNQINSPRLNCQAIRSNRCECCVTTS